MDQPLGARPKPPPLAAQGTACASHIGGTCGRPLAARHLAEWTKPRVDPSESDTRFWSHHWLVVRSEKDSAQDTNDSLPDRSSWLG